MATRGRKPGTPKTGGRQKGALNKTTAEVRAVAQLLVNDPTYRENLKRRLESGKLAPPIESMLWHYAFGKPADKVEVTGAGGADFLAGLRVSVVDANANRRDG